MTEDKVADRSVFACIDGSSSRDHVCDYSSWIAKQMSIPLKLLHTIEHRQNPAVVDFSGTIGVAGQQGLLDELAKFEQERRSALIDQGSLLLHEASDRAKKVMGIEVVEHVQRHGTVQEALIDLEEDVRVLVLGIRGETHDRRQEGVGTQLEAIIRSIHKPILVVNKEFQEPKKVMLAFDGSKNCLKALDWIAKAKNFSHIPCHVVHVGDNGDKLLQGATRTLEAAGIEVVAAQISGNIHEALASYQEDHNIDLTLMGAFSHTKIRGLLLGSFTAKMLEATKRPLLLLR